MRNLLLSLFVLTAGLHGFSLFSMDQERYSTNAGEIASKAGARLSGMGGAGTALADTLNYTVANPASFAATDFTIISVTYQPEMTYLQDKSAGTTMNFSNDFPLAELVVPLGRYGCLFGGYKRDRLLNYDVRFVDDQGYHNHNSATGGTYIAQGGYAIAIKRRLLLGASFGALYGETRIANFIESPFPAGVSSLMPSTFQKTSFYAKTMDAGVIYKTKTYSVGLSGTFPLTKTDITREHQIIQNFSATDSIVIPLTSQAGAEDVPVSGTLGLAYTPSRHINLALDVNSVLWDLPGRGNEYRMGLGMEYFFADTRSDNYFLNIPVRAGYYYHDLGLYEGILEQALTVGWSLPTMGHYGYLNFAVEGGKRYKGSMSESELTETFSKISIQFVHKGRWGRLRRAVGDF